MCCVVVEISVLEFPPAAAEAATAVLRTAAAAEAAAAAAEAAAAAATTAETGSAVPVAAAASEVAVAAIAMAAVARAAAALARDAVGKAPGTSAAETGGPGPRRCRGGRPPRRTGPFGSARSSRRGRRRRLVWDAPSRRGGLIFDLLSNKRHALAAPGPTTAPHARRIDNHPPSHH